MLTFEQIQAIAAILNWTPEEVEAAIAELNDGFMQPQVEYFDHGDMNNFEGDPEDNEAGFYHRLSAPGYMDCTDWSGPFETEESAVSDMLQMYAD